MAYCNPSVLLRDMPKLMQLGDDDMNVSVQEDNPRDKEQLGHQESLVDEKISVEGISH